MARSLSKLLNRLISEMQETGQETRLMPIFLLLNTAEPRRVISSHVIVQVKKSFVYLLGRVVNVGIS